MINYSFQELIDKIEQPEEYKSMEVFELKENTEDDESSDYCNNPL